MEVEVVVRALWSVKEVHHAGRALSVTPGAFRDAEAFTATLVSGGAKTTVEVDVTSAAWEEIEKEIEMMKRGGKPGTSSSVVESVGEVVTRFLQLRLSFGGANYWDPLRLSQLDLGSAEIAYLLGRSPVGQS
jgi:hypothetical protein